MTRHISENEYLAMIRRTDPPNPYDEQADEGTESELQSKIKLFCKQKGWPILSFPKTPKIKRFLPPGWPDDTIIMPHKVLFLEDKTKTGRLSTEQKLMKSMFRYLGHEIHEVKSYKAFLDIVAEEK